MKLIIVLSLAFVLRLLSLDQSLWLDEAITANVVKNFTFFSIINQFSPFDFHPPFYYLFMKLWSLVFGNSELALRMPSVLLSLLTGYLIYLIGREIGDKKVGFYAMMFFLFNPLIIYYSQEARMYMMATFFLTGGLFFLIKNLKIKNSNLKFKKDFFLFIFFIILAFYTFYGTIFFILAIFLYLFLKKKFNFLFISSLIFVFSFLLIFPLVYQQLINAKLNLLAVKNWSLVLGKANLKNLFLIPLKFSVGKISFYPKWAYYLISGGWMAFLFYQILNFKNRKTKKEEINLLLFLFIGPIFFGWLISFFTPLFQYFRFLYLIPIFCLLLSFLSKTTKIRIFILTGFVFFSFLYLFHPNFHRENWKNLVKSLPPRINIYMILSSSDPVKYYRQDVKIFPIEKINKIKEKKIIVIPYSTDIWGFDYKNILRKRGYIFKKKFDFGKVFFEIYEK